jgi:hypothetical protein
MSTDYSNGRSATIRSYSAVAEVIAADGDTVTVVDFALTGIITYCAGIDSVLAHLASLYNMHGH